MTLFLSFCPGTPVKGVTIKWSLKRTSHSPGGGEGMGTGTGTSKQKRSKRDQPNMSVFSIPRATLFMGYLHIFLNSPIIFPLHPAVSSLVFPGLVY